MKRASVEKALLQDGSGFETGRTVRTGLRSEEAEILSNPRRVAPAGVVALFDRYHETAYGLAMSILMNKSDAEEATRDVFTTVAGMAGRFQWNAALPFQIYRICVNTCLMRLRKARRTEIVPIEEFLPVFTREGAHARPVEDWSREVERRIPEKERGQVIGGFTAALPEKYLVVYALHDVHGFSFEETAQVLNLTVTEVKFRSCRTRIYLRERLTRYLRDGRRA